MSNLLLVGNPARRRAKKRNPAKRAASPAQKRARAAFARAAKARSRSNPAKRRATAKHRTHRARRNPIASRRPRRARRNPISAGLNLRSITAQLKSAAVGAGGAVGVDVLFGMVSGYLPASLATPVDTQNGGVNYGYYATKAATAIGAGLLLRRFLKHNAGRIVEGSLTVTMHDMAKQFLANNATSVPLGAFVRNAGPVSRLGVMNPGRVVSPRVMSGGLGQFVSNGAALRRGVAAR